jgi:hypothetical protein
MINIKSTIQSALDADTALTALLGGQNCFHQYPPEQPPSKFVIYYEATNEPREHFSETELISNISFVFYPYATASVSDIALAIDRIMTGINGVREQAPDADGEFPRIAKEMTFKFVVDNNGIFY